MEDGTCTVGSRQQRGRTMAVSQLRMTSAIKAEGRQRRVMHGCQKKVKGPWKAMIEAYKALEDVSSMLSCCDVESGDAQFLFPPSRSRASSLSVLTSSALSSCACLLHVPALFPVPWDSFLFSTCHQGQTPSLQPAGIVFQLQPEDTKLDSGEGNRIEQHLHPCNTIYKKYYLEICY